VKALAPMSLQAIPFLLWVEIVEVLDRILTIRISSVKRKSRGE
jgi:hypothetical protein